MPEPQSMVCSGICRLFFAILIGATVGGPSRSSFKAAGQSPETPGRSEVDRAEKTDGPPATGRPSGTAKKETATAKERQDRKTYGVETKANLTYRRHDPPAREAAGLCDVYLPVAAAGDQELGSEKRFPVVVLVHGGGWLSGNKWTMDRHARQLTRRGYACVSINYRLAPAAKFPCQVDDVRSALVWITENADQFGFDLQRVGLYGYSAGGHLVSLVATLMDEPWSKVRQTTAWQESDPRWKQLPRIVAVCAGGPPTDFRSMPPDNTALAYFLGGSRRQCPDIYTAASPICFASSGDPAITIVHGEADGLVPLDGAKNFYRALLERNVDATLETLPRKGHLMAFISPALTDWMLSFFELHLTNR